MEMRCWRRLRDWQLAGVWDLIHFALLDWLVRCDQIDRSRRVVDSCSIGVVQGLITVELASLEQIDS
jgi:transposase